MRNNKKYIIVILMLSLGAVALVAFIRRMSSAPMETKTLPERPANVDLSPSAKVIEGARAQLPVLAKRADDKESTLAGQVVEVKTEADKSASRSGDKGGPAGKAGK